MRADHLGCYGYSRPTSPNIDALAKRSLLFEDFVCEVPLTAPSFSSMMTSRYPRVNGNVRNGLPLPKSIPLLAELLQQSGYQTACVQSNWTLKAELSGLNRGFDIYDDGFHTKRWGLLVSERNGTEVAERAIDLITKRDATKPLFLWVHFSDPHAPYKKRRGFDPWKERIEPGDRVAQTRARYDSEIAFTDDRIADVLQHTRKENAYIVFLADHGESLYEHGYVGHGRRIYQDNLRVPLLIAGPGIDPTRSTAPARGIDIAPTVLGLAGLPPSPEMLGVNLRVAPPALDRVRVVETYGGAVPNLPGAKSIMLNQPPIHIGIIHQDWKLILSGEKTELYNLATDPGELRDLSEIEVETRNRLRALSAEWETQHPRLEDSKADLTNDDLEALKSLGYVD